MIIINVFNESFLNSATEKTGTIYKAPSSTVFPNYPYSFAYGTDGSNRIVYTMPLNLPYNNESWTWEMWAYITQMSPGKTSNGFRINNLFLNVDWGAGQMRSDAFSVYNWLGYTYNKKELYYTRTMNKPTHFSAFYDADSSTVGAYVNGVLAATATGQIGTSGTIPSIQWIEDVGHNAWYFSADLIIGERIRTANFNKDLYGNNISDYTRTSTVNLATQAVALDDNMPQSSCLTQLSADKYRF